MNVIPTTAERVSQHTAQDINQRIRHQIEQNLAHYGVTDDQTIERRLKELDQEWDIERSLEANAAQPHWLV
ncbi:hypothetical protein [Gimesia sp.]|uniref:hypothetical protein n=1 Tax=Gimesia sp. TaxID=2024833 RepID=UPI0025BBAD8F|nr:hypothetical protein [Gimesia sp.]|tara:strand:- start:4680 stop:4892 length:213 start_codon:yes stop_codon:yes gene_type:complete